MPDATVAVLGTSRVIGLEEAERRIDDIVTLLELFGHPVSKTQVRRGLESRQSILVGTFIGGDRSNDRLIGIAQGIPRVHFLGKDLFISTVVVHPEFRRSGYATTMVRTLVDMARAAKYQKVELTSSKPGAQALYRQLGFSDEASTLFRLVL